MCNHMQAYHLPCGHTNEWIARCQMARNLGLLHCYNTVFPVYRFTERFRCPACYQAVAALPVSRKDEYKKHGENKDDEYDDDNKNENAGKAGDAIKQEK